MTSPDQSTSSTTRIGVTGANCPWCFNEVLDRLRAAPAVESVRGSITEELLIVDHRGADEVELLEIVRQHLHIDARGSSEHVQAAVEPSVTGAPCPHCEAPPGRRPTGTGR